LTADRRRSKIGRVSYEEWRALEASFAEEVKMSGEPKAPWEVFPDAPPRVAAWSEGERDRYVLLWCRWWLAHAQTWTDAERFDYCTRRHHFPLEWNNGLPILLLPVTQAEDRLDPRRIFARVIQRLDELSVSMDRRISEEIRAFGEARPPWEHSPGESPASICWRMGGGEDHIQLFWEWWRRSRWTESQKLDYFRRHQPPVDWLVWAASAIWDEFKLGRNAEGAVQRLERVGIGSYREWVRREMQPPWEREES
jgi:hypothetical protein